MKREHLMDKFDVQEKNTSDSAWENSFLTEHEKILEDQTCRNHQDLTAFFRLISGVDQKTAEENIRRISQVIPREVLNGVSLYFNGGKYAARYLSDYELRMQYAYGVHACGISFFDVHKRYPRQLAVEHNWFSEKALLKIEEDKCVFSLRTRDSHNTEEKIFWYRDKKEWKQKKKDKKE